jgi:hypothetical protein
VYATLPNLTVFVAVFGVTMCLYATARARRPIDVSLPYLLVAATALTVIGAAIAAIVGVAATHPAATADRTHVFSILLALILTGYIVVALLPPPATRRTGAVAMWWALGGAVCSYAVWIAVALFTPPKLDGTIGYLWLVGAGSAAAAAIGAAVTTRSSAAGIRAGIITAILTAPAHVALDITTQLNQQHYTLSSTYDVTAYPRSGYPDIASYLLSDTIGGEILVGLIYYPILLCAVTVTCAALCGRRQPAPN